MIHSSHSEGAFGGAMLAPAPVVVEAEPELEEEPASTETAGAPAVIVVREHRRRARDPFERGWYLDPADHQDKFYGPDGSFIGRIDTAGHVWSASSHAGTVDTSPSCGVACKRAQARKILLGIPLNQ
jgi:hypothetical protein